MAGHSQRLGRLIINVHPVPVPNSEIKEKIMKRYERERIKIEKLLTLGYTTSGDP